MAGLYHPTHEDESDELTALRNEAFADEFEAYRDEHPELEDQFAYLMGDPDAGRDDCTDHTGWDDGGPLW